MRDMGTLRCDGCGEEFTVFHDPVFARKELAGRQAHWLEKVLTDEHERQRKHQDRIPVAGLVLSVIACFRQTDPVSHGQL
jgi:hypothetical protein